LLAVLAALAGCAAPDNHCQLVQVADLPVQFVDGSQPVIQISINGQQLNMLVDTGAQVSIITPAAMKQLGGAYAYGSMGENIGVNGTSSTAATFTKNIQIGRMTETNAAFFVDNIGYDDSDHVDGLIGEDILQLYNVALDFPNHRMQLYKKGVCAGGFPWAGNFASLPFSLDSTFSPKITFYINNHPFTGIIDTGAAASLVKTASIDAAGLTPLAKHGTEQNVGMGGLSGKAQLEQFTTVAIGGEVFGPSWLRVQDAQALDDEDALIGEDYVHTHRVYISNDTDTVLLGTVMPVAGQ